MCVPRPSQNNDFLSLFMGAQGFLRVYVRSLLFHRDEAREFAQEAAAVFWRKCEAGVPREFFTRRAFGVARMEVHAFRRDRARERHCFGGEVFGILAQNPEQHSDTLDAERRALGQYAERLPAPRRQLLEAAYAPGTPLRNAPGFRDVYVRSVNRNFARADAGKLCHRPAGGGAGVSAQPIRCAWWPLRSLMAMAVGVVSEIFL
jgi:RNA polymerase sigma-70 factor (ECF subfamily)